MSHSNKIRDLLPRSYFESMRSPESQFSQSVQNERVLHSIFSPMHRGGGVQTPAFPDRFRDQKTVYLSPAAETAVSSLGTPFSKLSHRTQSTIRSIRDVQPYKLQNIRNCRSIPELHSIIQKLRESDGFPALIKTAERRIEELVNQQTLQSVQEHETPRRFDSQSISMTLSPDASKMSFPSPVSVVPSKTEELQSEISRLLSVIVELEQNQATQQKQYLEKISRLEEIRMEAQQELATYHEFKKSHGQLLEQLERYRDENSQLHGEIVKERETRMKTTQKSQELERRLSQKIQELAKELARMNKANQSKTNDTQNMNTFLREAQDRFRLIRNERNKIMGIILEAIGRDKTEGSQISEASRLKAVETLVHKLENSRKQLQSLSLDLEKSRQEVNLLRQSRKKSEVQLVQYKERTRKLEEENKDLLDNIYRITNELKGRETSTDKAIITATKEQEKKWEEERAMYKQVIKSLRKRISQNDKMVPFDLYKAAVTEAKSLRAKMGNAGMDIEAQYSKATTTVEAPVPKVRKQVSIETQDRTPQPRTMVQRPTKVSTYQENVPPPSEVRPRRVKFEAVPQTPSHKTPDPKMHGKENKVRFEYAKTPPPPPPRTPSIFSPTTEGKTPTRATLVRAAGGRKALQERLRQIRSPGQTPKPLAARN